MESQNTTSGHLVSRCKHTAQALARMAAWARATGVAVLDCIFCVDESVGGDPSCHLELERGVGDFCALLERHVFVGLIIRRSRASRFDLNADRWINLVLRSDRHHNHKQLGATTLVHAFALLFDLDLHLIHIHFSMG